MTAYVTIVTADGQETLAVRAEDFDPFVTMTVRGVPVDLTRDEARRVSDALRAAGLRLPWGTDGAHPAP